MRYMMLIKATEDYEAGRPANPALMAGMGQLIGEMMKSGALLASEGLQPSSRGTRIKHSGGRRTVTDGPFAETKELIGGYAILRAQSKAEAIELANRAMEIHVQAGVDDVEIEIRPLFEADDFGPPPR